MKLKVEFSREELSYSGRIDWDNPAKPEFIFPASSLQFRFWGKSACIKVTNRCHYCKNVLGAIVDGAQKRFNLNDEGQTIIMLLDEAEDNEHNIMIFKRMDACHELVLEELELSEESYLLPPPPKPQRRIEVYGDSVSAGEVSEAVNYIGREDPEHNGEFSNSWYSYAWITARKLNAEIHNIAQGGAALLNGTGWCWEPNYIGMESIWDKIHYNPTFGKQTKWDFSKFIPHVVIVALGQNDSHPEDYMKENPDGDKAQLWKKRYRDFLIDIRKKYPKAYIVCCTTLLNHDVSWDQAIDQVCRKMNDEKVFHYLFRRNGKGTPGHLRIPEAEEMAEELTVYLEGVFRAMPDDTHSSQGSKW